MRKIIFIFLLFLPGISFSQPLFENIYQRAAGGSMSARAFVDAPNGCYYVIGSAANNVTPIIKIDSSGNVLWDKNYSDSTGLVFFNAILSMPDGGFAAAGGCSSGFLLMRGDSMGNVVWARRYNYFFTSELFNTMVMTSDYGFILSGHYWHISQPFLVRVDSLGNVIYLKTMREVNNFTLIYELKNSSDGNYFASFSTGNYPRTRVMKFDVDGNELWSVGVGDTAVGAIAMSGNTLSPTADGGCVVGGSAHGGQFTHQAVTLCKISSQATVDWIRVVQNNTATIYGAYSAISTYDHGFIVANYIIDTIGISEMQLSKTDSLGHFLWTKNFSNIPSMRGIQEKRDHGFTIASNGQFPQSQMVIFNTDSLGNALCGDSFINLVDSTITLPLFSPLYTMTDHPMTQDTIILTADSGIMVLDYCQLVSVPEVMSETSVTIFPNPFHTTARLEIENSESKNKNFEMRIYNTIGVLVRQEKILNLNSYILHRAGLSEGLYFYELQSLNYELISSGKFIIE